MCVHVCVCVFVLMCMYRYVCIHVLYAVWLANVVCRYVYSVYAVHVIVQVQYFLVPYKLCCCAQLHHWLVLVCVSVSAGSRRPSPLRTVIAGRSASAARWLRGAPPSGKGCCSCS